jgi:FkbM family methyltransferase
MARLVGPKGIIYAFEPSPHFYNRLVANVKVNTFRNITTEQIGLSDHAAIHKLSRTHSGASIDHQPSIDHAVEEIRTICLDEYVAQHHIRQVNFIKIDVDGHEYRVLAGAKQTIQRFLPTILIEIEPRTLKSAGTSPEEVMAFLTERGYCLFTEYDPEVPRTPSEIVTNFEAGEILTMNVLCHT